MNNNSKTAVGLLAVGLVVAAVSSLTPSQASAQEAKLMYACYMQGSGVVYRINPPDDPGQDPKLKDDCTGKKHVKFYWVEFVGADGKVGIGVPEPTAELDVAGDIHASGQLRLGDHTITIDPVTNTITSGPDEDIYILPGLPGTAGKVGIGTVEPDERLTVAGTVESTDGGFKFPDGTVQATAASGGGTSDHGSLAGLADDDHEQYVLADGVRNTINGFAVTGEYGTGAIPTEGAGTRIMWYPAKGAFRVGYVEDEWDDTNIGILSTATGVQTTASGRFSTAMSYETIASGDYSTAMGYRTTANGDYSTAMGASTLASEVHSTAMGLDTESRGIASTAMGSGTRANGDYSTAMGSGTRANGDYSTAMGYHATTGDAAGSFVYGDYSPGAGWVFADHDNQFVVRASGGVYVYTASDLSTGVFLHPGDGAWNTMSDRNKKENFRAEDGETVLAKIADLPIQSWNYKSQDASIKHIGPTAQDFYAAFGLGGSDTTITTTDISGVNMLAIQALERRAAEVSALRSEVAELRSVIEQLMLQLRAQRDKDN